MVEFMFGHVTNVILANISTTEHVAFMCDEVSTMGNGSWISIHAYVM
jgi:hypothetical protein